MELVELTYSTVHYWDNSCYVPLLKAHQRVIYARRWQSWLWKEFERGLQGVMALESGTITGFAIWMPIEQAPVPIVGNNFVVIHCLWTIPELSIQGYRQRFLGMIVEKISSKHGRLNGVCGMPLEIIPGEIEAWESLGFVNVMSTKVWGLPARIMYLAFDKKPMLLSVVKPPALPPPEQYEWRIDVFAPSVCPIGTVLTTRINQELPLFAGRAETHFYDTCEREVVVKWGRQLAMEINGRDYYTEYASGISLVRILERVPPAR